GALEALGLRLLPPEAVSALADDEAATAPGPSAGPRAGGPPGAVGSPAGLPADEPARPRPSPGGAASTPSAVASVSPPWAGRVRLGRLRVERARARFDDALVGAAPLEVSDAGLELEAVALDLRPDAAAAEAPARLRAWLAAPGLL